MRATLAFNGLKDPGCLLTRKINELKRISVVFIFIQKKEDMWVRARRQGGITF